MAKGYWVASIDVTDMDGVQGLRGGANAEPLHKYGAKFLTRGGKSEAVEGKLRARVVVIEFPSYEAALTCYRSPEYQAAQGDAHGQGAMADIVVIEGYDGPQP